MSQESNNNRYKNLEKKNATILAATSHLNFGLAIFIMIFAYLLFVMVTFAVKDKVNYTIAEPGVLTHSSVYTGMIIKYESVEVAETSGDIRYYFTEGARVRHSNTVARIIKDPEMAKLLDQQIFKVNQSLKADDPAFDESYDYLKGRIKNYVINQHNHKFIKTYSIKREIINDIDSIRSTVITQQSSLGLTDGSNVISMEENLENQGIPLIAPLSGLVSFNIDGMEDVTKDSFVTSDLDRVPTIQEVSTRRNASKGDAVFKVVDNYLWYIAAEIDDECEKQIEGKNYINLEFTDKEDSIDVKVVKVWDEGDKTFLMVEVDRMLENFLGDRFSDFRIIYDEHKGVKVPESAVTVKRFAIVPNEYMNIVNNEYSVLKKIYKEDAVGGESTEAVPLKQLKRIDGQICVPLSNKLSKGDVIVYTDPKTYKTSEFILDETVEMEGVYVVNKGYAIFKFIKTRYRQSDYRIVEPFLPYGVRMYDRIATEGNQTKEYQIIN